MACVVYVREISLARDLDVPDRVDASSFVMSIVAEQSLSPRQFLTFRRSVFSTLRRGFKDE